ncbi:hypothetical protein [Lewinella sp. IMCC34183]|uniref:hypothetical protein n=1 Tax=Lewinella sp. IMCC34183 TaxID=2248762 RepID=UPI000E25318B|nr:hypothetical protein [Lewinella sp. IMCC34183]
MSTISKLISLLLFVSASCEDSACKAIRYDLEVYVEISPADTLYRTTDTVTLTFNAPVNLTNRSNNQVETVELFDVGYELYFFRLDSVSEEEFRMDNTYDNIRVLQHASNVRTDFTPGTVYFNPELQGDTAYVSTLSFSFRNPGVYFMQFNGFTDEDIILSGENLRDRVVLKDGCPKAIYEDFIQVNGGANNNVDILCETREEMCTINNLLSNRTEAFDRAGGYIFKVRK